MENIEAWEVTENGRVIGCVTRIGDTFNALWIEPGPVTGLPCLRHHVDVFTSRKAATQALLLRLRQNGVCFP